MIDDWLKLLCQLLPGVTRAVVVRQGRRTVMASWPQGKWQCDDLLASADTVGAADTCAFLPQKTSHTAHLTHIVCNLSSNKLPLGKLCVELPLSTDQYSTTEHLILWSTGWLELLIKNSRERASGFENILAILTQATAFESLQENSYTLATALAQQFGFVQVIVCTRSRGRFATQAVSNALVFERKVEQLFLLEKSLHWRDNEIGLHVDFGHWLQSQNVPLAYECLPIVHGGHCYGAVVCTWPSDRALESQIRAQLKTITRHIAPSFASLVQLKEPILWRVYRPLALYWEGRSGTQKVLIFSFCLGSVLLSLFLPVTHTVKGPASLEGRVQRAIVSPEDGYLMQAEIRAGEVLEQGQIVARLDQKSILLEIKRWQSEKQEYEGQFNRELNALNHTQMRIAKAKVEQAEAKLDLHKDRLKRLTITAPIDGIVIKGDLSRAVGSPVERGQVLYEMAPLDEYKLVIMVAEKDIRYLDMGQQGRVVLSAYPNDAIPFTITSVASVFETQQEGVFYRVEAELEKMQSRLRPGMSGVAKVEAGRRPVGWVVIHPLIRWLRLKSWAFSP